MVLIFFSFLLFELVKLILTSFYYSIKLFTELNSFVQLILICMFQACDDDGDQGDSFDDHLQW